MNEENYIDTRTVDVQSEERRRRIIGSETPMGSLELVEIWTRCRNQCFGHVDIHKWHAVIILNISFNFHYYWTVGDDLFVHASMHGFSNR